ncbi:hypothetical protein ANCCEY_03754 [Ancylostoma ceylanicum]|uniref:7TM GPCR serpentine receptor class x (Srx) domain-containing protein n=1 Tax=Ancylostoma ceylanicum TaxID=53326 RepID=A0A0D6M0Z4_9BILA|nr:hypothetical protein ANCCEY_03754 [Ancylostoma ceylanicum]
MNLTSTSNGDVNIHAFAGIVLLTFCKDLLSLSAFATTQCMHIDWPLSYRHAYFLPPIVGVILGNVIGGMVYLGGVITQVLVLLCWLGTLALAIVYSINGVGYIFHEEMLIWQGDGQEKSTNAFADIGLIVYVSTATMFILNIVTFARLIIITICHDHLRQGAIRSNPETNPADYTVLLPASSTIERSLQEAAVENGDESHVFLAILPGVPQDNRPVIE